MKIKFKKIEHFTDCPDSNRDVFINVKGSLIVGYYMDRVKKFGIDGYALSESIELENVDSWAEIPKKIIKELEKI